MLSFQRLLSTEKIKEEFDTESDADKHSESELPQETEQACDEVHCGSQSLDTSADVVDDMDDDEDAEEGEILEDGELVDDDEAQKADADAKPAAANDDDKQKKDDKGEKKRERTPSMSKTKEADKKKRKRRRRESDEEENDSDNLRTKRRARDDRRSPLRATSPDSASEGSESNDEESDMSFSEEMMLQMFKQMMDKVKKESGENKKKSKMEKVMEKMMRNQSNMNSRDVREMFLRNKRLFRTGNLERDRSERTSARAVRDRERRLALRQGERRLPRDRERERGARERETTPRERDRERIRERDKERQRVEQSPKLATCKFFLEGKCHRGSECPFPHDAPQQKKKDICKFYLQGYCGKGEHCLFMHGDFPCKFFHTGAECYSGDNCRFSHQPLTEETRSILKIYLDSGELPDEQQSQATGTNNSSGLYQPVKPVPKRHAILGDVTDEMRTSYWTWIWQQEMKELELAYTGNKRNLFCIEKPFAMTEKPQSPEPMRGEDFDERERTKVMSFYIDTMADVNNAIPAIPEVNEDAKLLELSYHDEDLRLPLVPTPTAPPNVTEGVNNSHVIVKSEIMEPENMPCEQSVQNFVTNPSSVIPEESLPKTARDLLERIRNKNNQKQGLQGEDSEGDTTGDLIISNQDSDLREKEVKEEKKWLSESEDDEDDDTEDQPLKAALKNLQTQQQQQHKEETSKQQPKIDIAKMLSVIRQTTTQMSGASAPQAAVKQADFWQTIFSGCSNIQSASQNESRDPRLTATPPQNEPRDPRLKRAKAEGKGVTEVSASPTSTSETVPKVEFKGECEFKLLPVTVNDIDYSSYVGLYRSDLKLKNDPRLQKFFSKLPNSVIDHLSKILPTPAHQSSVSSTSTLQSIIPSSPTNRSNRSNVSQSEILPPLPPLTLTQPRSTVMSPLVPPPPPLMSPFELTSSKPSFAIPNPVVKQEIIQEEEKLELKPQVLQMPSPLLSSTTDTKPIAAHLPQGLTSLVSLVTSKTTTSDLRKNLIKKSSEQSVTSLSTDSSNSEEQSQEIADRPLSPLESAASPSSEVLTIAEDTPVSPTSRRSSSEIGSPPLQSSTVATPLSPPKEEPLIIAEPTDDTRDAIKDVFKTIDPTASPFC